MTTIYCSICGAEWDKQLKEAAAANHAQYSPRCKGFEFIESSPEKPDHINSPTHYGGADNLYETIKVIEAWDLGFNLGNCLKYISRAGKKGSRLEDLEKAKWYLEREIKNEKRNSRTETGKES